MVLTCHLVDTVVSDQHEEEKDESIAQEKVEMQNLEIYVGSEELNVPH